MLLVLAIPTSNGSSRSVLEKAFIASAVFGFCLVAAGLRFRFVARVSDNSDPQDIHRPIGTVLLAVGAPLLIIGAALLLLTTLIRALM